MIFWNFFKEQENLKKIFLDLLLVLVLQGLLISEIQKIFNLRTCNDVFFSNRSRACLQYQIGKCSGPCVGLIEKRDYEQDVFGAKEALKEIFQRLFQS